MTKYYLVINFNSIFYSFCYNGTLYILLRNSLNISDKKLIIFDFDGTLINSGPDLAASLNYMLNMLGREKFSLEIIDAWVGNGAQTLVKRALSGSIEIDADIDDELFKKALKIFLDYYEENVCVHTISYPNVKDTLTDLKKRGYISAIVTNKPYKFVKPILKKLELFEFFAYYIGGDSLMLKKPDPAPLLHVCERLGIDTKDSVMVGDSKNDIIAASRCKMQSIGVSYGYNYGEDITEYNPSVVIDDFKDILRVLI